MLLVTICSIVFFPRPVCNGLHDWWVLVVNVGHHGVFLHPLDKAPVVGAWMWRACGGVKMSECSSKRTPNSFAHPNRTWKDRRLHLFLLDFGALSGILSTMHGYAWLRCVHQIAQLLLSSWDPYSGCLTVTGLVRQPWSQSWKKGLLTPRYSDVPLQPVNLEGIVALSDTIVYSKM